MPAESHLSFPASYVARLSALTPRVIRDFVRTRRGKEQATLSPRDLTDGSRSMREMRIYQRSSSRRRASARIEGKRAATDGFLLTLASSRHAASCVSNSRFQVAIYRQSEKFRAFLSQNSARIERGESGKAGEMDRWREWARFGAENIARVSPRMKRKVAESRQPLG